MGRRITGRVGWKTNPANRRTPYYYHNGGNVLCEYLCQGSGLTATLGSMSTAVPISTSGSGGTWPETGRATLVY